NIEFRFIKPDGSVRWALGLGRVFYNDDGNPVRMAGVDRDISAWKQAEATLLNSERRYRSLVEATAQIIWNTQGNQAEFTTEQPSWSAFTGQTFDELKGWGWLNAIHPDDRAKTTQAWLAALDTQTFCEVEYRLRRQDGVYRHMQVRAVPMFDENGTVLEWVGVHSDITDSKQAESVISANEARLRGFVESNVVGIIYGDIHGNIHAANDELLRMVGYTQEDVRAGRLRWVDITPPEYLPLDEQRIAEALTRGACTPYEKEYIRKDGSRVPVLIGYSLLGDAREETVVFVLDLSGRKQTEEALRQSEEFKNRLLDSSPDCIKVLDIDGRLLYMNAGGMCIMEIDDLMPYLNQDWVCFWGEEYRPLAEQALEVARAGEVSIFRGICPTAKGTPKWWEVIVSPIRGASGQTEQVLSVSRDISDRRQVELRLRESEERLQLGMQVAGFALVQIDYSTNTVNLSPEAAALYGLPADRLIVSREQFHATFHPEDQAQLEQRIQAILDPDSSGWFTQDYRIVWNTGEVKWLTLRKQVFFDRSSTPPQPSHAILVALDITERKQAEQELQENELRFRTLADNISQLAWMTDEKGWVFWYNQRWFDFTGTTLEEMQGWGWQKVHHPDYVERVVEKISQCFATGEIWEDLFPLRGKNGEYRWFLSRAVPIRDEQGRVLRWFGTNTDITELREVENALRQSEERYRCLADSIPQLVWISNSEGVLLDVNQRWTGFTGLSLEQARADGWEAVVHPEDVPVLTRQWTEAAQRGTPYQAEGRMRRADGTYRWFLHQAIPQRNEQGQIIKWFGTATDIDVQKQLELARDRLLQQEQAAREAAERANRIKDEFLAVLSHELRSPLNPILGWTKLLQSRKFDATRTADALATIERNAKLQTQLIDDLLDVAKILRGKLVMEVATVDLTFVIESAIDTVRAAAAAKSIRLHSVLPHIGHISGDSARLQQIIWNLLSNAIKFTPNDGQVDILLERVGNQAQITVQDTGKGINPNFLPYLFESFRQEDASTTRKYGGLGLGLAIVRSLVEAHGGTIAADSPGEGQGATFTVCFPLLDLEPEVPPLEQHPLQDLDLTGVRVLAVDDEPDARDLLAMVLTVYGAEVLTVTSAAEVLAALGSFQPDVLVSDIGMPDIDGYCLIQHIRALPAEKGGGIPAIALTAYAREEDHQRAIASGFQQQVTKPLEPEQLVQVVVALVRNLG
ncbi:MAG: PAS domain S-box protein, partial [Actinomycetota bacterium]